MEYLHETGIGTMHFRQAVTLKQLCDTFAEYSTFFEKLLKVDPDMKVLPIFCRSDLYVGGNPHPYPYIVRIFSSGPAEEPRSPILVTEKDGKIYSAVTPTRHFSEEEFKKLETIIGGPDD